MKINNEAMSMSLSKTGRFGREWSQPLRDMGIVSIASAVGLALNFCITLLPPVYMAQNDYGLWRIFLLYSGYGGLLHLGLVDGALIRWAGHSPADRQSEINTNFAFLIFQQIAFVLALGVAGSLLFGRFLPSTLVWAMLIYALLSNLFSFFQYCHQAFKSFGYFAASTLAGQVALLSGIVLLGASHRLTVGSGICVSLVSVVVSAAVALAPFRKVIKIEFDGFERMWQVGTEMIQAGFLYLAGNFSMILFFGLDKIIVSQVYSPQKFALYAFPSTLLGTIYLLVSALTTVSFPHLSGRSIEAQTSAYGAARSSIIIAWGASLGGYFLLAVIIKIVLPAYADSLQLLRILLLSVGFGSLIRSTHYNYYRIGGAKSLYFLSSGICLCFFAALLIFVTKRGGSLEHIAWCSVGAAFVWFFINEWALRKFLRAHWCLEIARLVAGASAFGACFWMISALGISPVVELLLYVGATLVVIRTMFTREFRRAASFALHKLRLAHEAA